MKRDVLAGIACSDLSRSERLALYLLHSGARTAEDLALHCFPGSPRRQKVQDILVGPKKDDKDARSLLDRGLIVHTADGWEIVESKVAALAVALPAENSQADLPIGATDGKLGNAIAAVEQAPDRLSEPGQNPVPSGTGPMSRPGPDGPVPDGTCGFAKEIANLSRPGPDASRERLNVKTFEIKNVKRLNVDLIEVQAAVREFVGENDWAKWWERAKYLWENAERVASLDSSLRYLRAGLDAKEVMLKRNKGAALWSQAQRDWREACQRSAKTLASSYQPQVPG